MFHTMQTVVTNLRIPEDEYRRQKLLAVEDGGSFNEYVVRALRDKAMEKRFGKTVRRKGRKDFYEAMEEMLADKTPNQPMGLSEEDMVIYGE